MSKGHDHEEFTRHYQETKNALYTYLMYRVNFDREIAEDLLMDIVLKAYEHFHSFNPQKSAFKNWIFTIAHNHLLNHYRDQKSALSLEAMEEAGKTVAISPLRESASGQIERQSIEKILRLLKASEREIITLRYLNELSYEEIAAITGKNPGAIRTSLSRAINEFKKFYLKIYSQP